MPPAGFRPRSNQDWIADIGASGERCNTALKELRVHLVAGLRRALPAYPASIEDAAQEALLRVSARLASFRGDSQFVTWAMSIAVRIALSELRRFRWRDVSLDQMAEAGRIPLAAVVEPQASAEYDAAQLMAVVHQAIQSELTEKQRQVIQAELGGAPTDEIAKRLQTNRNALYKLVYDARVRLKEAILRAGWTQEQVRKVLERSISHDA